MFNISSDLFSKLHADHFLVRMGIVILVGIFFYLCVKGTYSFIRKRFALAETLWRGTLLEALYVPLQLAILISTCFYSLLELREHYHMLFFGGVELIYQISLLAIGIAAAISFIQKIEGKVIVKQRKRIDLTAVKAIGRISHLIVMILGCLMLLQILGIPLSAVIAFGGVGGIAVGFAAKDFLANLFGGLMIFIGRPFSIGDEIKIPDRNLEGIIEQVSWRQSILRTPEQRVVYVPNSLFSTVLIENISRMKCRRILFDVAINLDDFGKMPKICSELEIYLQSRPDIDHNLKHFVKFIGVKEGALIVQVWCYPMTKIFTESLTVQQEILMKLYEIVMENKAKFAPTASILIPPVEMKS